MRVSLHGFLPDRRQAKENADELVAKKKEIDAQVAAKRAESKEFEAKMRARASNVGNIVGKNAPVSLTEVSTIVIISNSIQTDHFVQDDNVTIRKYHPKGEGIAVEKRTDIMPHHEALLRLDAMDLERGIL